MTSDSASSSGSDEVAAASGSNRFVVWTDETSHNTDVLFRRSTDNGASWKPAVNLSDNPGGSQSPQILVSGSKVYVIWLQGNSEGTLSNIFFRASLDNGVSWGAKIKVSSSGTIPCCNYQLAASSHSVYVVWDEYPGTGNGSHDVFFRRSIDNGDTWKAIANLSSNGVASIGPHNALAVGVKNSSTFNSLQLKSVGFLARI